MSAIKIRPQSPLPPASSARTATSAPGPWVSADRHRSKATENANNAVIFLPEPTLRDAHRARKPGLGSLSGWSPKSPPSPGAPGASAWGPPSRRLEGSPSPSSVCSHMAALCLPSSFQIPLELRRQPHLAAYSPEPRPARSTERPKATPTGAAILAKAGSPSVGAYLPECTAGRDSSRAASREM